MSARLIQAFASAKERNEAAFVAFVTAGYPEKKDTPSILMALQEGGASVIELGVPYTDPQADGATIQKTNQAAIAGGTYNITHCLAMVSEARSLGLTVPVVLMGYFNIFLQYSPAENFSDLMVACREAQVDGFIVVDLPPTEAQDFTQACVTHELSYIPLIAPTTTNERIQMIVKDQQSLSFIYCVSVAGVTGARAEIPSDLADFLKRVRSFTDLPLAVGFGFSTSHMVQQASQLADGVVVGSAILNAIDATTAKTSAERADTVRSAVQRLTSNDALRKQQPSDVASNLPTSNGGNGLHHNHHPADDLQCQKLKSRFGRFGGQFIPETLSEAFREFEAAYEKYKHDEDFLEEISVLRREFVGGPTPLQRADRLTELVGGATIWLKREDLAHTGSHKINNAIGQALLAKRLGKPRIIAETGAGQHGVATATVCAKFGLDCTVYMGAVDCERQKLNVFRMNTLGTKVVPVQEGQKTLKDAINEAMRDWVTNVRTTHYLIGSAVGPHPFPTVVRDFQSVIGRELKAQMLEKAGKLPDAVVACVGGGSNAIGSFYPFVNDEQVALYGVEAGGHGVDKEQQHCATLAMGTPGVLQGALTYVIQQSSGQTLDTHSISAGLDYPGVGPEHAYLKDIGRATYVSATDEEALEGFNYMCRYEGIIPALETSHAIFYALRLAKELGKGKDICITMSGRGDKDMPQIAKIMGVEI